MLLSARTLTNNNNNVIIICADPQLSGCSPRALRARAGAMGAWLRASVDLVTSADGSETGVYTLDPDFHRTLRVLRAQPAGAFVVFETSELARAPAASAHWGGDPALALVRTSLAEGDVLVLPIVRLPTGASARPRCLLPTPAVLTGPYALCPVWPTPKSF
jgi:hypothetical protein